jgi:hypothetical protein
MHSSRPADFSTNASRCRTESFPDRREKTLFNPQRCPLNIEKMSYISGLDTIRPNPPQGNFGAVGSGLAAEFGTQHFACVFRVKAIL